MDLHTFLELIGTYPKHNDRTFAVNKLKRFQQRQKNVEIISHLVEVSWIH